MDFLAFLPAAVAAAINNVAVKPKPLPTFKPRWWYNPRRLDARPVIWSLYNRPEEWTVSNYDGHHRPYTLRLIEKFAPYWKAALDPMAIR